MQLRRAAQTDIIELMSWFNTLGEVTSWAGPGFRFPFSIASFAEDVRLSSVSSWILQADDGQILGFGQYSMQSGHCHLSRLVIHPQFRGHGFIQILLAKLLRQGKAALQTRSASLFVFKTNPGAMRAYQLAGFIEQPHPQGLLHELCSYMVLTETV